MGVRVYDSEDMFSDEDSNTACTCSCASCHDSCTSTSKCHNVNCCPTPSSYGNTTSSYYMSNSAYKDIVGNCKEVRIEDNTSNLRIVGNNNRIRISVNTGDLIVIGNNTRLKIQQNHGHIKYTGNDGRISLGHQSQQQLVDYIGCNGVLKICNSTKSSASKAKCSRNQVNDEHTNTINKPTTVNGNSSSCKTTDKKLYCQLPPCGVENAETFKPARCVKTTTHVCPSKNGKSKEKSHSYSGTSSFTRDQSSASSPPSSSQWNTFNHIFQERSRKSMPNLSAHTYEPTGFYNREQPSSIIQNIGNIVISNASNICIAPYARNVTTKA